MIVLISVVGVAYTRFVVLDAADQVIYQTQAMYDERSELYRSL